MLMKLCSTLISSLPRAPDCREKKEDTVSLAAVINWQTKQAVV